MSAARPEFNEIKRLIWVYFWMLIFEGTFRKWIVPGLSTPLLMVRDPVVLLIYFQAMGRNIFPWNGFISVTIAMAVFCFVASLGGVGSLKVILVGLHADFLHIPLIFIIPRVFDYDDVKAIGRWLLLLSAPMALLVFLQFRASPDAWLNNGVGGEQGGQLMSANGRVRPAGVFSFVTGMVSYITLVSAYLAHHFVDRRIFSRWLIYLSMVALVVSLAFSGSRSEVIGVAIVIGAVTAIGLKRGISSVSYLKYALIFFVVFIVLSQLSMFKEGLLVHQQRFESGGGLHEGIIDRFVTELVTSVKASATAPLFGYGLGVGTNAGAGLLTGERVFLLSEGEWGRLIMESGPILGMALIVFRFALLFHLLAAAWRNFRSGYSLPLLLLAAVGLDVITGQFGQPTELGFVVFAAGLSLVPAPSDDAELPPAEPSLEKASGGKIRGRSVYADALHGPPKNDA